MATFEEIKKANESILTTTLQHTDKKGVVHETEYAEVNQRIKAFRMVHPNGTIETDMVNHSFIEVNGVKWGRVLFQAVIRDENGKLLATGHAEEKEQSSYINKTSYIENCETSAVGRALGLCGFGIDTSVASFEEVQHAIEEQDRIKEEENKKPTKAEKVKTYAKKPEVDYRTLLINKLNELNIDVNEYAKRTGLNGKSTQQDFEKAYNVLIQETAELGF